MNRRLRNFCKYIVAIMAVLYVESSPVKSLFDQLPKDLHEFLQLTQISLAISTPFVLIWYVTYKLDLLFLSEQSALIEKFKIQYTYEGVFDGFFIIIMRILQAIGIFYSKVLFFGDHLLVNEGYLVIYCGFVSSLMTSNTLPLIEQEYTQNSGLLYAQIMILRAFYALIFY